MRVGSREPDPLCGSGQLAPLPDINLGASPSAHFTINSRSPEAPRFACAPAADFSFRLHTPFSPKGRVASATLFQSASYWSSEGPLSWLLRLARRAALNCLRVLCGAGLWLFRLRRNSSRS